jgi:hypothetical protein
VDKASKQRIRTRKRAPGGGRKPKGEFAGLSTPLSIRMPPEMRAQLEAAARKSGRSISQELLTRLNDALKKDRNKAADPAMRALCFLFSSLAYSVHWNMPNWRSDPYLFRAIKIGICKLLDALEPTGEMKLPDFWRAYAEMPIAEGVSGNEKMMKAVRDSILPAIQSPETMAEYALQQTLRAYASPRPENWEALRGLASMPGWEGDIGGKILKHQEDYYYGMKDAKRDLAVEKSR